jgi:hypothetical protein
MKKLCMLLLIFPFMAFAQEVEERILTMSEFKIKQGHSEQFKDGAKKWKECYIGNEGTDSWNFWERVQGEGTVYGLTGFMDKWAEMDETDPAGKDCRMIVKDFIMPHVEKATYNLAMTLPDWSRKSAPSDTKLVWVTYFRVKNSANFSDIIKEMTGVISEKEGEPRGNWFNIMGGDVDAPDYMVSTNYGSYAELDIDKDSPYQMYLKAKGEKKTKEMGAKWDMAVEDSWSYIYELNTDLSKQ